MNLTNETYFLTSSLLNKKSQIITGLAIGLQIVIALLAVLGNSFIVAIFLKYKTLQDSTSAFIIHLAFTDLITGFAIFVVLAFEPTGLRPNNYVICLGTSIFIQYLALVSQTLILVTTFERYVGICKRENYNIIITRRVKFLLIFTAWALPFPMSFLPMFGFNYWEEVGCLFPHVYSKWTLTMRTLFQFLESAISMVFYFKILLKAKKLRRQVRPGLIQGINPSTIRYNAINRSIKSGRMTALVTMIFFASWLPYNISVLAYCLGNIWISNALSSCFKLFGISNSMVNPFLYAWQRRDIRGKLKSAIKCRKGERRSLDGEPLSRTRVAVQRVTAQSRYQEESFEMRNNYAQQHSANLRSGRIHMIDVQQNTVSLKSYINLQQLTDF